MSNDMRNIYKIPGIQGMSVGSHAFLWRVSSQGYRLCNEDEVKVASVASRTESWDEKPPWLIASGVERWQKTPLKHRTLHREFASISPKEEGIISFANKHGLLGYDIALEPASGLGEIILGESILRWKKEMNQMGSLLALWDLVRFEDKDRLEQLIIWPNANRVQLEMGCKYYDDDRKWRVFSAKWPEGGYSIIASQDLAFDLSLINQWRKGDVIGPAKYYICREVNEEIKGCVYPQVLPFVQDKVYLFPKTLLSAMWLMFMWEISGETKVLLCSRCGQWVDQLDPRQKYCSDACKQHAYRERQRTKETRP